MVITEDCLKDYLKETEDERTVGVFFDTYDSDESDAVYDYAADDGRILSEEITYCNDFEKKYAEMLNRADADDGIPTKENYYWTVYTN